MSSRLRSTLLRIIIAVIGLISATSRVDAERSANRESISINFSALKSSGKLHGGELRADGLLSITLPQAAQTKGIQILSLGEGDVTQKLYALEGEIAYFDIAEPGYLELITTFPDGSWYFSRTLANSGPMRMLHGSSDWHRFVLPFDSRGATAAPTRLDFNVVLPRGGGVQLRNITFRNFSNETEYQSALTASEESAKSELYPRFAMLFTVAYVVVGVICGLLAFFCRGRAIVRAFLVGSLLAGIGALLFSAYGSLSGQAFASFAQYTLFGIILCAISLANYRPTMRRFDQAEIRRMEALDRGMQ